MNAVKGLLVATIVVALIVAMVSGLLALGGWFTWGLIVVPACLFGCLELVSAPKSHASGGGP